MQNGNYFIHEDSSSYDKELEERQKALEKHQKKLEELQKKRKRKIEVCEEIAKDMKQDAIDFDGREFNSRNVAEYFGHQGAAIAALANILQSILEEED